MNNTNIIKVFFDYWEILDTPEKIPFFSVIVNDTDDIIIKNTLRDDDFVWICKDKFDFTKLQNFIKKKKIIICCANDKLDFINAPYEYEVNLLNKAIVYEFKNKKLPFLNNEQFNIRNVKSDDFTVLKGLNNLDELQQNYVDQVIYNIESKNFKSVYVLEYDNSVVSFLIIKDINSIKYSYSYKLISLVFTLPEYRCKGFAKYLISDIINKYYNCDFVYAVDSSENFASNKIAMDLNFDKIGNNNQFLIDFK